MVLSRHALPNGRLHQPRQGREHVDGGIDLGKQKEGLAEGSVQLSLLPLLVSPPPPRVLKRPLLTPPTERWAGHALPSFIAHKF